MSIFVFFMNFSATSWLHGVNGAGGDASHSHSFCFSIDSLKNSGKREKISISHFVCLKFFYLIWVKFWWKCRKIDFFGSLKISIHVSALISHKKTHKIKITPTEKPSNANKIHQFYVFTPNFAPLQIKIKFKSRSRKQISISNNHNSANKHVSGPKKYHFLLKLEKDTTLWSESN